MAFRAKCRITSVTDTTGITGDGKVEQKTVVLQPVYGAGNDDANKEWSRWTPSGELRLSITNPAIFPELVCGKSFFVDFSPID